MGKRVQRGELMDKTKSNYNKEFVDKCIDEGLLIYAPHQSGKGRQAERQMKGYKKATKRFSDKAWDLWRKWCKSLDENNNPK